ncbi:MAG: type II secretion system F family protein, partial [Pirellulales bacterium]|nr:type II secretion system F family protein [Pirellulales bacterium]
MVEGLLAFFLSAALAIAGLAILWAQGRAWAENRRTIAPDWLASATTALGWVLFLVGVFAAVGLMAHAFFLLAWIVAALILITLFHRYRAVERRSLLWTLMLAAERGIPLHTAARAFAEERRDATGQRVRDLAEYLEAGLPLALALKRSHLHFPQAVLLSAELGQQTGNLGSALRKALGRGDDAEFVFRSAVERVFYLACLVFIGLCILTFMMVKIVPALVKILTEFSVTAPAALRALITVSRVLIDFWPAILLLAALGLVILVRSLSRQTVYSPRYLPGMIASWQRADRSVILQWLAHAVRQGRPLPEMMRLVAGYLTRAGLRRKLQRAAKRIDQGAEWTGCLQKCGLIRKPEAAVFRAAERTGNLAWALEEMA